jgi:response regulator RpfG family c-di-GMP phosphodiesterase
MITNESATHFDPAVVNAFIEAQPQFISIREHFRESKIAA